MKKVLFVILLIGVLFSEKLIICQWANARDKMPFSKSKDIGNVMQGEEYEIVDRYSDYQYVEIIGGSIHKGKKGYMWSERIKNGKVIIEGVSLRSEPKYDANNKDKYRIAKIRVGARIRILRPSKVIFYKILVRKKLVWVWYRCVKIIK